MPLELFVLFFAAGLMSFVALHHAASNLTKKAPQQSLFAVMILLVVPLSIFQAWMIQSSSIEDYLLALRLNITAALLFAVLLPWFIRYQTGYRALWQPVISGLLLLFIFLNWWEPHTLQYGTADRLTYATLPWGERVAQLSGSQNPWGYAAIAVILADYLLSLAALVQHYRAKPRWLTIGLIFGLLLSLVATGLGISIRLGWLDWPLPGPLGFLGMVLVMSLSLSISSRHELQRSEQRFRALVEQSPYGIQLVDATGMLVLCNPAWQRLRGMIANDFVAGPIQRDHYVLRQGLIPYIERALRGETVDVPARPWDTGHAPTTVWIHTKISPIRDDAGHLSHILLVHENISAQKQMELAIHRIAASVASSSDDAFFEQMARHMSEVFRVPAVLIAHWDHTRLHWLAHAGIDPLPTGLPERIPTIEPPPGNELQRLEDDPHWVDALAPLGFAHLQVVLLNDHRQQRVGYLVLLHHQPLDTKPLNTELLSIFAARASAELQRQAADRHIRALAYQDELTGLCNRACLRERLTAALQTTETSTHYGALILMDLDHFKLINEALGHDAGDTLLQALTAQLQTLLPPHILLSRVGGDEFALFIPPKAPDFNTAERDAAQLCQQILNLLSTPLQTQARQFSVNASLGFIVITPETTDANTVLSQVELALYQAKNLGRNNVQPYVPALQTAVERRLSLEEGLRPALDRAEFHLVYQPQVNAAGQFLGAEVLLRWQHPVLGNIAPTEFIPLAEESGLIHPIGLWVFDTACRTLAAWLNQQVPFFGHLAINVSAWQLADVSFVGKVHSILRTHGIDPRWIMLEITESMLLQNPQEAIDRLHTLRDLGLRISLDDFGTGYSSLAYLKDLPLDQLKIDKSFIDELQQKNHHPLIESMYAIAEHMALTVVAEGVETEQQCQTLIRMGAQSFQGYLFSKPLTEADFLRWLDQHPHVL
ncbi:EAL domain-containing protein [Halothiobacillus sp. DCM-1]|uniref:EAL domain-containing protein n=1 Tax=Halothiobacillus sp. DCM-1 TaxID=3112558 RepID=UPI0032436CAA